MNHLRKNEDVIYSKKNSQALRIVISEYSIHNFRFNHGRF